MENNIYQEIFNKQKEYFNTLATYDYKFRKEMLLKLKHMIIDNIEDIYKALYLDLGKSKTEAYMCEIGLVLDNISYTLKHLKRWMKEKKVRTSFANFPSKGKIIKDPYGTTLIISPWNYPFLLSMEPLIGSIIGGNTCILKLSEISIHTSKLIKELIDQTFNLEFIYTTFGSVEETTKILELPFDFTFFTGSEKVGKIVMQASSKNLTPVCLELGGKSPCIVTKHADLELASKRIIFGKIINAGQTCVAPDYIYVDSSVKNKLIELLIKYSKKMITESPLKNDSYPKIISSKHLDRLKQLINKDKVVYGGKSNEEKLELTILDNVSFDDDVMKEEIFGPILPIIIYDTIDEVKTKLHQLNLPLALYIFSNNKKEIKEFTKYFRFGGACVNDTLMHLVEKRLPFGGVKTSGMGRYHGKYTFDTFTKEKAVLNKSTKIDISLRYPPYYKKKESIIKKILK